MTKPSTARPRRPRERAAPARRAKPSPIAIARELQAALDARPGMLDRELAEQRGLSPSFVSRHLALLRMPESLQRLVDEGLGVLTALQVHALPAGEQRRVIAGLKRGEPIWELLGRTRYTRAARAGRPRREVLPPSVRQTFASRLREARQAKKWTQAQLRGALDLGTGTIGTWETGIALPSTAKAVQLAGLLGVSLDWLFGLSGRRAIDSP